MKKVANLQAFALSATFWMFTLLRLLHISYGKTLAILAALAVFGAIAGSKARRVAVSAAFWPLIPTVLFLIGCWLTARRAIVVNNAPPEPSTIVLASILLALVTYWQVFEVARVHRLRHWFPLAMTTTAVLSTATMLWYGRLSWWYALGALLAGKIVLWVVRQLVGQKSELPAIHGVT